MSEQPPEGMPADVPEGARAAVADLLNDVLAEDGGVQRCCQDFDEAGWGDDEQEMIVALDEASGGESS